MHPVWTKQSGSNLDGSEGNQLHFYTCLQLIEAIIRPIALIKEFIALHCVQENFHHIYDMYLTHVHSTFGRLEKVSKGWLRWLEKCHLLLNKDDIIQRDGIATALEWLQLEMCHFWRHLAWVQCNGNCSGCGGECDNKEKQKRGWQYPSTLTITAFY